MATNLLENPDFKEWLKAYWFEWRRIILNSQASAEGRELHSSTVMVPFLPLGYQPAKAFDRFFTRFIMDQLDAEDTNATMLTILGRYSCSPNQTYPYILYEPITNGHFAGWRVFRDKTVEDVIHETTSEGKPLVVYRKYVPLEFLWKLFEIEKRWREHEDRPRFLLEWFAAVWSAFQAKEVVILPPIRLVESLLSIFREHVRLLLVELGSWARIGEPRSPLERYLANLTVRSPDGQLKLDLHLRATLEVQDLALFALLNAIRTGDRLDGLYHALLEWVFAQMREGRFALAPCRWLTRWLITTGARRARRIPSKAELLSKIIADPMRLLVAAGKFVFVLRFDNGRLSQVKQIDTGGWLKSWPLREKWLAYSQQHEYIHLAVEFRDTLLHPLRPGPLLSSARALPGSGPPLNLHPRNEFVRRAVRMGPLCGLVRLLLPFATE